jgi:DNA-binding MurR/RpiR family transcriptional regulator
MAEPSPGAKPSAIDTLILESLDTLTPSERRLADVILDSLASLPSFTAGELAARARVSNATAARFFQRLGFKNYAHFRRRTPRGNNWGSPLYELTGIDGQRLAAGDFGLHVAQDLQNLTRTAEMLQPERITEAISILAGARGLWIVGFRNSYALASYARGLLVHLKPDVRLLPVAGMTIGEDLVSLGAKDALLVIGFRRRPLILREIMAVARERRARSVLLTDLTAARTARLATVTLRCQNRGHSMFDSYAAPISVINYLCAAVGMTLGDPSLSRLTDIEALHDRLDPLAPRPAARRVAKK